ncbi:MAG: hypothetical protein QOF76_2413 [Solirubrobacteraceae bacterium]|nr:hypothetical protein [Solirubrobacteraceae bacterium]
MEIGVDTSGKFLTGEPYEPTVVAATVGSAETFAEIGGWTNAALERWGVADRIDELHAKKLRSHEKLEVCRMLADRGDVRLAAVATDTLLLGSVAALAKHRDRQLGNARAMRPQTVEGRRRKLDIIEFLGDEALSDGEYALAAILPLVGEAIVQQALCYFRGDEWRDDMSAFRLLIDEEAAPTMRYGAASLLPSLGGDERFSWRLPVEWREEPVHPLLVRSEHRDGDGLMPQAILGDMRWVSSAAHPCVQVADVAAWVLRRALAKPGEPETVEMFEIIKPLLEGEHGVTFQLFSVPPLRDDQLAMYSHLQSGEQPLWWLTPVLAGS